MSDERLTRPTPWEECAEEDAEWIIAAESYMDQVEAERDELVKALREIRVHAETIENISWGWDGDCGADWRAVEIKDAADALLAKYPQGGDSE